MKQRLIRYLVCMLACLCMLFVLAGAQAEQARAEGLEVHFMDIGRNDGILIRCGGEDVFIDSGGYRQGRIANAYMQSVGVTKLKYYIGTHAHNDHVGGAPLIIEAFKPDAVIQPHDKVREAIIKNIRSTPERAVVPETEYVTVKVGDRITVGDAVLTVVGPVSIQDVSPQSGTENNNSLVLMLTYGEIDILLSADATTTSFRAMEAANPGCLKADIYKNAHHNQQTREELFQLIQPEYVIFSTAKGYMPKSSYLEMLNAYGAKALLTSPNHSGNVILRTDGSTYSFETQYSAQSLTLRQSEFTIYEGKTATIKATLKPSGRFKALTYTSSDPAVATVNGSGKITGVSAGEAIIYVRDASGVEAECKVTVNPAELTLRKTELSVKQHSRVSASWKIQPSGSKAVITWASADESIATVDQRGRITGVYPGQTTITATMPSGQVSSLTITVKPISVSSISLKISSRTMTIGDSRMITAKVSPKNATWPSVTWSSADESIVTISQDGTIQAVGVGRTTVSATTVEGKTRSAQITVKPLYVKKITVSGETGGLVGGVAGRNQVQLSYDIQPAEATIQDVTWTSSNKRVATVDENGLVTGLKAGTVTITCKATDGSGKYGRIKITFGANELVRKKIQPVEGEMIVQAERIRYTSNQLEIRMTWVNRSGEKQLVPQHGILTLVTPDGTKIPLTAAESAGQTQLRHRSSKTVTYKIPLASNPRLIGLDLTRCDAVIEGR